MPKQETIEELSAELLRTWGRRCSRLFTRSNLLIRGSVSTGNLLAFGFISEVIAKIVLESCELARASRRASGSRAGAWARMLHEQAWRRPVG